MHIIDTDAHPPFGTIEVGSIGTLTAALFFERLQKARIRMATGTLLLPPELSAASLSEDALRCVNAAALSLAHIYPDRYQPGIHVNPDFPECSCQEIVRYADRGVRILGEIQSDWLADAHYQKPLYDIFSCAEQYGMTVSVHPQTSDHLQMWAQKFPSLKFMYGSRECRSITPDQSAALLGEYPNLYLRLSQDIFLGNYYLYSYVNRFPIRQLLFGSGYPLCNPAARTAACLWELRDQTEEIKRKIFHENAVSCLSGEA